MEFFRETHIDFMGLRKYAAVFSGILFTLSIVSLVLYGLNFGLDFTGGTQFQIQFPQAANLPQVRKELKDAGFKEAVVMTYGASNSLLVKIGTSKTMTQKQLKAKFSSALPTAKILSDSFIGPQVGKELATNGILALLVAMLATTIYIAYRFEYRFAVSSAVALIHDPIIILGIFSYLHIEFDITVLASVLTVIGYSLNDTIVVFDRIRENFRKLRKSDPSEIVNLSVNQTLSRTVMTSGLTLIAVVALFLFGGPKLHGFSLAMIIGIVIGTYSSIYVAGSLSVALGLKRADFLPTPMKEIDDRP